MLQKSTEENNLRTVCLRCHKQTKQLHCNAFVTAEVTGLRPEHLITDCSKWRNESDGQGQSSKLFEKLDCEGDKRASRKLSQRDTTDIW